MLKKRRCADDESVDTVIHRSAPASREKQYAWITVKSLIIISSSDPG